MDDAWVMGVAELDAPVEGHGDAPWLDDREEAVWRGWIRLSSHVARVVSADLRESSLNTSEFGVLATLDEAPGGELVMGDLARGLQWEPSRLSHQVARMVRRGLVTRRQSPTDGRSALARITPEGRAVLVEAAPGHVRTVRREFLDPLTEEEQDLLLALATKILRSHEEEPPLG